MASRESVDLSTPNGRRVFFRHGLLGDKYTRHYARIDTLGHHICPVIGHSDKTYLWDDGQEQRLICLRCGKKIEMTAEEWPEFWEYYKRNHATVQTSYEDLFVEGVPREEMRGMPRHLESWRVSWLARRHETKEAS